MRLSPILREDDFSHDRTFGRFARQVTAVTPRKSAAFVDFCRVFAGTTDAIDRRKHFSLL
ncbi:hypothetical protein [Microcoleus sp. EPA2]|uniref:hypothetical protein n=1 Tax=Microcoleus sp. EPA2 TaxID=2841654 RepID=UPI00312B47F8